MDPESGEIIPDTRDVEPQPESIEGMPSPDALTPEDRYLELFENV